MKNLLLLISLLLLIRGVSAQAGGNALYKVQQQSNEMYQDNLDRRAANTPNDADFAGSDVVVLDAHVLINVKTEDQLAVFNVIQVGETAAQSNELMEQRIKALITALEGIGIGRSRIFIDMVSQAPIFETETTRKIFSKTFNEVPKGFELQKNVHILYTRGEQLDQIVRLAADQEIYDIIKVDYFVQDLSARFDTLRNAALAIIAKKKAAYEAVGVRLDSVMHLAAEAQEIVPPAQQYRTYETFGSATIEAVGKKTGLTQVQKARTLYYNPMSYSQFDQVIHPIVLEPVVQQTYVLKVKYHILPRSDKPQPERQHFWLTPNGQVMPIKVD